MFVARGGTILFNRFDRFFNLLNTHQYVVVCEDDVITNEEHTTDKVCAYVERDGYLRTSIGNTHIIQREHYFVAL